MSGQNSPQKRLKEWRKRLYSLDISKREWNVRYFPEEKRFKVRGEFTNDEGNPLGTWLRYPIWYIEKCLDEFERF